MGQSARSFHDILQEKLDVSPGGEEIFESVRVSPEAHSNTLAFESFFSQLHNTVDAFVSEVLPGVSLKKTPYAQGKTAAKSPKNERPTRPERTKIRSQLSAVEVVALSVFVKFGAADLEKCEILGETIIKKTYRRLAVNFHPDTNQSAQGAAFRELHEAYSVLSKMFRA